MPSTKRVSAQLPSWLLALKAVLGLMSQPSTTILSIFGCFNELNASAAGSLFFIIRLATSGVLSKSSVAKLIKDKNKACLLPLNAKSSIISANRPNKGSGINKPPSNFLMANIMSNIKS